MRRNTLKSDHNSTRAFALGAGGVRTVVMFTNTARSLSLDALGNKKWEMVLLIIILL